MDTDAGEKRTGRGPKPIERTVRRLFAEQVACAHPDCDRRLIDVLDNKQIQICEVAHICAFATDGPRSDSTMSAEQTREFENLLLLCKDHHDLVDEYEDDYPVHTLVEWKSAQRQLSLIGGGEYISDAQVEAALARFTGPNESAPYLAEIARTRSKLETAIAGTRNKIVGLLERRDAEIKNLNDEMFIYDSETGDRIQGATLSNNRERDYRREANSMVQEAMPEIESLANELRAEVAAADAVTNTIPANYKEWLKAELNELIRRHTQLELDEPNTALDAAVDSILDLIGGASPRTSPPEPEPATEPTESEEAIEQVRALLDRTQPYLRASNRPYNSDDARAILALMPSLTAFDSQHDLSVQSFMYRLVAMLKTATTDERNEVIAAIETMPDGVIAEFAHIATVEDVGYTLPDEDTDRLRSTVIASVEANINKPDYWKTNGAVVTQVFRLHAGITSNEATAELLAGILENDDDLCLRLIRLYAGVNVNTGEAVFLVGVGPPTPPWIPIEPLIAAVRRSHPDLGDVTAHDARFAEDSERRFAASFLVAAGAGSTAVE